MGAKHALRLWGVSGLSYEKIAKTREREREREDSIFLNAFST